MDAGWVTIGVAQYIKLMQNRTRIIWLGRFFDANTLKTIFYINWIHARERQLLSAKDWNHFIKSCYLLECVDEKDNWTSLKGQKQHFVEWMSSGRKSSTFFKFDHGKFNDHIFCTVFDTHRNNRLIIDGLHRAYALTLACHDERKEIPVITITECFGQRVDIIFPCDIHQLPLNLPNW